MMARKLGPVLASGCTLVLKPAPDTPYSALAIMELAQRAGVPDGVLNIVTSFENVNPVGVELCENKTVKMLTFTGSSQVAKLLYKQAAGTMKKQVKYIYPIQTGHLTVWTRVSIEAGGNAPFIVFDDADIDVAIARERTSLSLAWNFRAYATLRLNHVQVHWFWSSLH